MDEDFTTEQREFLTHFAANGVAGRKLTSVEHLQDAVAIATLSAQFAAHQASCTADKAEIKQQLANQDAERKRMHLENRTQFGDLATSNHRIQRVVWMAAGAIATLQFLASNGGLGALLKALSTSVAIW